MTDGGGVVRDLAQTLLSEGVWTTKTTKWYEKHERGVRLRRCLSCVSWSKRLAWGRQCAWQATCQRKILYRTHRGDGEQHRAGARRAQRKLHLQCHRQPDQQGRGDVPYPASGASSVRPHAVTGTSNGGAFSYNNNGNMTSRLVKTGDPTYTQTWDCENRLASVTGNPTPLRSGDCAARRRRLPMTGTERW